MKFFLTALIALCLLFHTDVVKAQACTPNLDTVSGIEPDTLSIVYAGVPYEQVIYFRLPADTIVLFNGFPLLVCIDSLTIDSVQGLPENFSFACNIPWCAVHGGSNGCAAISGTASINQVGIYPIKVFVSVYTNDCYTFPLPTQVDTVDFYFLDIQNPSSVGNEIDKHNITVKNLFPNPASDFISFILQSRSNELSSITIKDFLGHTFLQDQMQLSAIPVTKRIDVSAMPPGVYYAEIKNQRTSIMKSFVVAR